MITLCEAKPGQGKTTLAMKYIEDYLHFSFRKYKVASNVPTVITHERYTQLPPTGWAPILKIIYEHLEKDYEDVKKEGTLVIILDELSLLLNARNWDTLPPEVQFILRQHRHFGVDIIGFSQSVLDIDVSYRRLIQRLFSVTKIFVLSLWGFTYGLFFLSYYDSDDVDTKRIDRQRTSWSLKLVDPPVYKLFNSWERYRFPTGRIKEEHYYEVCALGHKHRVA